MLRKKIKQYIPDVAEFRHKYKLGILGDRILEPRLWHFHRRAVSWALTIGIFVGLLPLPGHMIIAAILAVLLSANLPLAVMSVWVTNPITLAPISYIEYKVGVWLLQRPPGDFHISWTWEWFVHEFVDIFVPMFIGSLFLSVILAVLVFILTRLSWRYRIIKHWNKRKQAKVAS